jgi:hypothetical protein
MNRSPYSEAGLCSLGNTDFEILYRYTSALASFSEVSRSPALSVDSNSEVGCGIQYRKCKENWFFDPIPTHHIGKLLTIFFPSFC